MCAYQLIYHWMSMLLRTGFSTYRKAILLFPASRLWQMMACLSISDSMQPELLGGHMKGTAVTVGHLFRRFCSRRRIFLPLCFSGTRFVGVLGDGFHQIGGPEDTAGKSFWRFLKIFRPPQFSHTHVYRGHVNARKNAPKPLPTIPAHAEVFGRRIRQQIECVNERQGRSSRGFHRLHRLRIRRIR